MSRQKVYEYVEVDDSTPIQTLSLFDQLRVVVKKITYDPGQELKRDDAVTVEVMTLKANLMEFFNKATEPIRLGNSRSVTVSISSVFKSVLEEVLNSSRISNFYNTTIRMPQIEYDISYSIDVRLEVK